jgi:hypothetical protein
MVLSMGLVPTTAAAQRSTGDWCDEGSRGDRGWYCQVREETLGAGALRVNAGPNGGIRVEAANRPDVLLLARVEARAETDADARALADQVRINTAGNEVTAEGPSSRGRHENWSVSFRLYVPARTDLSLRTVNGGISIDGVRGEIDFRATNGGVKLAAVGGNVRGSTVNGGLDIELDGQQWDGQGLDVETSNGGVKLAIPEGYSAELETGTSNGGLRLDIPITIQGELTRKHVTATLGGGGPRVRAVTTNGGVAVRRR